MSHRAVANLAWSSRRSHQQVKEESDRLERITRDLHRRALRAARQAEIENARITHWLLSHPPQS